MTFISPAQTELAVLYWCLGHRLQNLKSTLNGRSCSIWDWVMSQLGGPILFCHLLSNRLVSTRGAAVVVVHCLFESWGLFPVGSLHVLLLFHLSYSSLSSNQQLKTERRCEFESEWWFVPNISLAMSWQLVWDAPCLLPQGWDSPHHPSTTTPLRDRDDDGTDWQSLEISGVFPVWEKNIATGWNLFDFCGHVFGSILLPQANSCPTSSLNRLYSH